MTFITPSGLRPSINKSPSLHGAYILEKKDSKQMSKYMIRGVVVKLMKGVMSAV